MASVSSTYARAFADVVFSAHLDAARVQSADCARLQRCWRRAQICAGSGKILRFLPSRNGSCSTPSFSATELTGQCAI